MDRKSLESDPSILTSRRIIIERIQLYSVADGPRLVGGSIETFFNEKNT